MQLAVQSSYTLLSPNARGIVDANYIEKTLYANMTMMAVPQNDKARGQTQAYEAGRTLLCVPPWVGLFRLIRQMRVL